MSSSRKRSVFKTTFKKCAKILKMQITTNKYWKAKLCRGQLMKKYEVGRRRKGREESKVKGLNCVLETPLF